MLGTNKTTTPSDHMVRILRMEIDYDGSICLKKTKREFQMHTFNIKIYKTSSGYSPADS